MRLLNKLFADPKGRKNQPQRKKQKPISKKPSKTAKSKPITKTKAKTADPPVKQPVTVNAKEEAMLHYAFTEYFKHRPERISMRQDFAKLAMVLILEIHNRDCESVFFKAWAQKKVDLHDLCEICEKYLVQWHKELPRIKK